MDQLQTRLDALEQQMHTVTRRLRWWRGLACGAVVLAVLTWALPLSTAQEEASEKGQKGLAHRVAALEQLLTHFSREGREIFITGANLHIVSGLGETDCTDEDFNPIPDCPNGLGNLIVGYNEPREIGGPDIRTGSHNVVVGLGHNFSSFGGLVVGFVNTISGDFASVSGGQFNTASGNWAAVSGGNFNTASGAWSVVSGGGGDPELGENGNTASGEFAVVSGGSGNAASGGGSVVGGGHNRTAEGEFDWVAGTLLEDE